MFPAVYMSCMRQNFRLFHVSNLSVRNFRIVLLIYTVCVSDQQPSAGVPCRSRCRSLWPAPVTSCYQAGVCQSVPGRPA